MEFGNLIEQLMKDNALALGMDISDSTVPYWMERVTHYPKTLVPASVAHVCAERPKPSNRKRCPAQNMFSLDGMHYCMKTVGGRIFAAIGCLLGCSFNLDDGGSSQDIHEDF